MKIANTLIASFTAALVFVLFSGTALAFDNYKDFRQDHWDFDVSSEYYRTESNFGSGGTQQSLGNGNYFQMIDVSFGTRYVLGKRLSLFVSGDIASSESKNSVATRNNSSFNQVLLGTEYLAYSDGFDLIPEVSLLVPLDKVSTSSGDTVLNSEGVIELRPKITLQKDFGAMGGYAYGGFTYRDEGRSFLLPWGVGAFLKFGDSRLGAEVFGTQSVTDDKDTNNQGTRSLYLTTADAGSYRFASFNPSLIDSNFFLHMNVHGAWSFELAGGLAITGSNSADGYHAAALIRYSFDMSGRRERTSPYTPMVPRETPRGRSEMYNQEPQLMNNRTNHFREDTNDGVDQHLFRPKPMTPVQPDQDSGLQQQLDDTEMQIELKTTKKKKRR